MERILTPKTDCPLCSAQAERTFKARKRRFFGCGRCGLVYADRGEIPDAQRFRARYLLHKNGLHDEGYCRFLMQVIEAARPYIRDKARGLDFGCGPNPTLSALALKHGIGVEDYDPIFCDKPLTGPYDVIFATECFEHFVYPAETLKRLTGLLAEGGVLAVMTELWDAQTDFERWHYASDETHVSFFSKQTFDYLEKRFGIHRLEAGDAKRVFVFGKKLPQGYC